MQKLWRERILEKDAGWRLDYNAAPTGQTYAADASQSRLRCTSVPESPAAPPPESRCRKSASTSQCAPAAADLPASSPPVPEAESSQSSALPECWQSSILPPQ